MVSDSSDACASGAGSTAFRRSANSSISILGYPKRRSGAAARAVERAPARAAQGRRAGAWTGFRLPALAALALSILAACSVTDYQKPIGDMAAAVDQSVATIDRLDKRITAIRNEQWRNQIAAGDALLLDVEDACSQGAPGCWLEVHYFEKDKETGEEIEKAARFPAASMIPKAQAGLVGLKLYVANLRAMIDADTADKVAASANAALGSLKNIETTIREPGDPSPGPVAKFGKPTVGAVNWLIGQYVDHVKVRALKRATGRAQPVVVKLAGLYDAISEAEAAFDLGKASADFVNQQEAYDEITDTAGARPDARAIGQYVLAAKKYDQALRASSARPLKAFAEAHATLTDQLHGKISLPEALAAIERFVVKAKEFEQIVDEFDQAFNEG